MAIPYTSCSIPYTLPYTTYMYPILCTCLPSLTNLSMISNYIHAIKEGHQQAKLSLCMPDCMLIKYGNGNLLSTVMDKAWYILS